MVNSRIINESIDYIIRHLEEGLTAEKVAGHFNYSKYYFCRSFKQATGESLYAFIRRLKLDQSAVDIKLERHRAITEIGMDYGYSSSNYSSAFKSHHLISPAEFRKTVTDAGKENPFYPDAAVVPDSYEAYDNEISIDMLPSYTVIYERFIGNYAQLKERWVRFVEERREAITPMTLLMERFYHDPAVTDLTKCICDLCMTVEETYGSDNTDAIAGGRFAVYRYQGRIADIYPAVQGLFSVWLPHSGYEMDQRFGLNIYREMNPDKAYVTMDVCVPIRRARIQK